MHISGLKQSRFLTRADVGRGILVTIAEIYQDNVAKEGAPEEYKWCIRFVEHDKPMVLNATNGQIIASICHSEETDDWPGHKVVLYDDPNISFAGKLVGGIRARAPKPGYAGVAQSFGAAAPKAVAKPARPQPPTEPPQQVPPQEPPPRQEMAGTEPDIPF